MFCFPGQRGQPLGLERTKSQRKSVEHILVSVEGAPSDVPSSFPWIWWQARGSHHDRSSQCPRSLPESHRGSGDGPGNVEGT